MNRTDNKCKYCKWYQIDGKPISICLNKSSINDASECIEQIGEENLPCDDKESDL